jgi:hypothetical protein
MSPLHQPLRAQDPASFDRAPRRRSRRKAALRKHLPPNHPFPFAFPSFLLAVGLISLSARGNIERPLRGCRRLSSSGRSALVPLVTYRPIADLEPPQRTSGPEDRGSFSLFRCNARMNEPWDLRACVGLKEGLIPFFYRAPCSSLLSILRGGRSHSF